MKMNTRCECCGQSFEPEPGYYFGAMYVSYAINTLFLAVISIALYLLATEITLTMIITVLLIVILGFLPLTFRWSRVLWIAIFVKYEGPSGRC